MHEHPFYPSHSVMHIVWSAATQIKSSLLYHPSASLPLTVPLSTMTTLSRNTWNGPMWRDHDYLTSLSRHYCLSSAFSYFHLNQPLARTHAHSRGRENTYWMRLASGCLHTAAIMPYRHIHVKETTEKWANDIIDDAWKSIPRLPAACEDHEKELLFYPSDNKNTTF